MHAESVPVCRAPLTIDWQVVAPAPVMLAQQVSSAAQASSAGGGEALFEEQATALATEIARAPERSQGKARDAAKFFMVKGGARVAPFVAHFFASARSRRPRCPRRRGSPPA